MSQQEKLKEVYERVGAQEFVPFQYEEVTIANIKQACLAHYADNLPSGMVCDILASERGVPHAAKSYSLHKLQSYPRKIYKKQ